MWFAFLCFQNDRRCKVTELKVWNIRDPGMRESEFVSKTKFLCFKIQDQGNFMKSCAIFLASEVFSCKVRRAKKVLWKKFLRINFLKSKLKNPKPRILFPKIFCLELQDIWDFSFKFLFPGFYFEKLFSCNFLPWSGTPCSPSENKQSIIPNLWSNDSHHYFK